VTDETPDLAAVDLGSNSFHMVVAREIGGRPRIVDRLRDRVALAEGLDKHGALDESVQERALRCLELFGQRLAGIPAGRVRCVGTATLRRVRDDRAFHTRAEQVLDHEIVVLPGVEEARLVYLGVAHTMGDDEGTRLVVDIGGGSTECILGERFEAHTLDSLSMGCVTWSRQHFADGRLRKKSLNAAKLAARVELETLERAYRERGWQSCIGSSGTILAVAEILRRNGWSKPGITLDGIESFVDALLSAGHVDALDIDGLKSDRKPVIAGGIAILSAVFEALGIDEMQTSPGALREGLLYDLLGRIHHEDVRTATVAAVAARCGVDTKQAERVSSTALHLFAQVQGEWGLSEDDGQTLQWAAELHEAGMSVAYSGHHKHGAYLLANADLPGFSREGRQLLAVLVREHRRKIDTQYFGSLTAGEAKRARRLVALLRIAARLHRSRGAQELPLVALFPGPASLLLRFPVGWLLASPLSGADLDIEASHLRALGIELEFV